MTTLRVTSRAKTRVDDWGRVPFASVAQRVMESVSLPALRGIKFDVVGGAVRPAMHDPPGPPTLAAPLPLVVVGAGDPAGSQLSTCP
jgi:hypothetical protein